MNPEHSAMVDAAFAYGIPLTFNLDQVQRYVEHGIGANPAAAFNTFSHARTLAGPADTFVSINNDTLYSMAQLDLGVGPVLLEVPDTAGRYYVLQFVDAWTNNFAYVGHRATGTGAGRFLIVPPGWEGETPADATRITAPTLIVSIVGRWACGGADDLPAVHALQDATRLTQLDPAAIAPGLPVVDSAIAPGLHFLEKLRLYSRAYPPAERDAPALAALAPLGSPTRAPARTARWTRSRPGRWPQRLPKHRGSWCSSCAAARWRCPMAGSCRSTRLTTTRISLRWGRSMSPPTPQ